MHRPSTNISYWDLESASSDAKRELGFSRDYGCFAASSNLHQILMKSLSLKLFKEKLKNNFLCKY